MEAMKKYCDTRGIRSANEEWENMVRGLDEDRDPDNPKNPSQKSKEEMNEKTGKIIEENFSKQEIEDAKKEMEEKLRYYENDEDELIRDQLGEIKKLLSKELGGRRKEKKKGPGINR